MNKQIIAVAVAALLITAIGIIWYIDIQDNQDTENNEDTSTNGSNNVVSAKDTDSDGLSDKVEAEIGTDPNNPNTDGDRYTDGEEYDDTIPSYVGDEGRSPLFPAYPDIEVELGETYHIWLKQDITTSTSTIESSDYEYNVECTTSSTTDWSNVLTVEAGFGVLGPSVSVKDTFSYHNSKTHIMKTSQNYHIATGSTWSRAVATDLGDSYLYITVRIKNIGNDILNSEINDIWLNLYIGNDEDPIKTWSFGNSYIGSSICPLLPGDVRTINAEFKNCLKVETLKRIDSGEPVRIEVQSYNIGDDHTYLQNIKDTLVQLDIDTGSDVETIYVQEDNMLLLDFLEKYADAVITSDNSIHSINGLSISSNEWWNIILPKETDLPGEISIAEINSGDHVVLIYEQDNDNDGITDRLENMAGTNPNLVDSDGDGLNDYDELYETYGKTSPILSDSDFDKLSDYEEVFNGNDGYVTDPQDSDTDSDGLDDYSEYLNNTNPTNSDSDSDDISDYDEIVVYGTDPLNSDSDYDGLSDFNEINSHLTDPMNSDTDYDGINDGNEVLQGKSPLVGTFYPADDTFVYQESSDSNYGSYSYMRIRNNNGIWWDDDNQMDVLIKFDISNIPSNLEIDSATLYLYYYDYDYNNPYPDSNLKLYKTTAYWNEDTVTWNSRPINSIYTANLNAPNAYGWISWEVTNDVKDFIDGTYQNYGWKIIDDYDWDDVDIPLMNVYTKEYASSDYHPYLEVEYSN